jgi:glycosyltransferase involved in cell wall biosynthesis
MNKKAISCHALFIPSWYPTFRNPVSGIFIQQQAQALQDSGLKIGVLFFEERLSLTKPPGIQLEKGISVCRSSGFTIPKRVKPLRYYWLKKWEALFNHYIKNCERPDILHAHSFVGGFVAQYLSQKYGIPYVLTEHYSGFMQQRIPRHWKADLNSIYNDADKIIAVSEVLRQALQNFTSTTIEVIPNMVDTSIFYPANNKDVPSPLRLITVGSLIKRKNISFLLRVLSRLEMDATLTVVGDGPLLSKLKREARQLDIHRKVTFTGNLPPEGVADAMRQSHIFVFASKAETFGVVLIEALACGLPIVSTPCGISEEMKVHYCLDVILNETEMSRAVRLLYTSRINSKDENLPKILVEFNKETITSKITQAYQI